MECGPVPENIGSIQQRVHRWHSRPDEVLGVVRRLFLNYFRIFNFSFIVFIS